MDQLIGKEFGNYEIVELIGKGGMAVVYKAHQTSMNRYVAVKVMSGQMHDKQQFIKRFKNEAQVIAQLEHPHILPVYDFGEYQEMLYIVMRYMPTGTLEDRIEHEEDMPFDEVAQIIRHTAEALDYAHNKGIIHRDLKPANILIDSQGNSFLTDFGIAKSLGETQNLTGTGGVVGTPAYMSPEQGMGQELDARADVYALGIMLYEMLTGRVPFTGENPMAVMIKHINEVVPGPSTYNPQIHPEIEAVVMRALAKQRDERYPTAGELASALEHAIVVSKGLAEPEPVPPEAVEDLSKETIPAGTEIPFAETVPSSPAEPAVTIPAGQVQREAAAVQARPAADLDEVQELPKALSLSDLDAIDISLNALSQWLADRESLGRWVQAVLLSLATFVILQRMTSGALVEIALLALVPGLLIYGLLKAPGLGALVSMLLFLPPLLAHAPGMAVIWLIVALVNGTAMVSRENMLTIVTMAAAGSPLGLLIPLLAPWWIRTRKTYTGVGLGVMYAMLFALTLGWPVAGGLLPIPELRDSVLAVVRIQPFNTGYLTLFEDASLWSTWADPLALWETLRGTAVLIGDWIRSTNGLPFVVTAAWATASTLSTSNRRVQSMWLRASGPVLAMLLLFTVHVVSRPDNLDPLNPAVLALAGLTLPLTLLLSQWPIQADPAMGNHTSTILRVLRQTLGALFAALGLAYFVSILGDSVLYPLLWIGGLLGILTMIGRPVEGSFLIFGAVASTFALERPVMSGIIGGLWLVYLIISLVTDKRRPRRWNPLGAGFMIGAPGMAHIGLFPLGPLSLGALEAQIPAALLALSAHVLLISLQPRDIGTLAIIAQLITTLFGVLVVERLMAIDLLSNLHLKVRRLIFTIGAALLMALSYYTLGDMAPSGMVGQALLVSVIAAAMLVIAMANRAMFWHEFVAAREEELEEESYDEEIAGPQQAAP